MSHPTEQLTDLVDGTLPDRERAAVLAHLRTCARCTAEAESARVAREALRSLEAAPVPARIEAAAVAEAERQVAGSPGTVTSLARDDRAAQRWYRVAAGAGIAAVLLLGIAVALPRIGNEANPASMPAAEDAGGRGGLAPTAAGALEIVDRDLNDDDLRSLAEAARAELDPTEAGTPRPANGFASAEDAAGLAPATDCLRRAFEQLPGAPVRMIQARVDGTPAYVGVFESGPGAGQAPDAFYVLAAASEDCRILSSTRVAA
jgi:hypothetical protein